MNNESKRIGVIDRYEFIKLLIRQFLFVAMNPVIPEMQSRFSDSRFFIFVPRASKLSRALRINLFKLSINYKNRIQPLLKRRKIQSAGDRQRSLSLASERNRSIPHLVIFFFGLEL